MRIAICAKVVPSGRHNRRIDPETGYLVRDAGTLSDLDRHAIEEALQIRDRTQVDEIVVICMAPASSTGAVMDALAMGVDRAIHIADRVLEGSDLLATSRVLAQALRNESPDLILFGPQGEDSSGAMLWAAVAARLDLPVMSQAEKLVLSAGSASVVRQTEAGYETLEAPLPCVVGVAGSINQPRFAPVKGKLTARNKPNVMVTVAELGLDPALVGQAGSGTRVIEMVDPPARAEPLLIRDGPDVGNHLYELLRIRNLVQ